MPLPFAWRKKKDDEQVETIADTRPVVPTVRPYDPVLDVPPPEPIAAPVATAAPVVDTKLMEEVRAARAAERAAKGLGPEAPVAMPSVEEMAAAPTVTYEGGRPVSAAGPDFLESQKALQKSTNEYIPQKIPRWRQYLAAGLQGLGVYGAARTGNQALVNQNAVGLMRTLTNRKFGDEAWKAGQQEEIGQRIGTIYDQEKDAAQLEHLRAQTGKLDRTTTTARPKRLVKNKEGFYIAVDAETGLDASGKPVQGATATDASEWTLKEDQSGALVPVNKKTGLGQDGKPVYGTSMVAQPDGSFVSANTFFATNKQFGNQDRALNIENQQAEFENAQLKQQVDNWTHERDQLDRALKATDQMVKRTRYNDETQKNETYDAVNPIWTDYMERRRAVNDKILGVKFKPIVKSPPRTVPTVTSGKSKIPAKTNHTQQLKELGILK